MSTEPNRRGFRNLPIATKLNIVLASSLILLFMIGVLGLSSWLTRTLEQQHVDALGKTNGVILSLINAYSESLEKSVQQHAASLGLQFDGSFALEAGQQVEIAGVATPLLKYNGSPINGQFGTVDRFTAANGVVATIFARQGDDLIRITTSLKKEDGTRAVATALGSAHPAHARLLQGEPYTGKARLFGRDYMTYYEPIKDAAGQVIAVLFVGLDFTEGLKALKQRILALNIGETGYVFAIDAGKDKGTLVIHPAKEGSNILASKDANGREFIREMLELKNGVIHYAWQNQERGESSPREKVSMINFFEKWNWVIGSSSYVEEFTRDVIAIRNVVIGMGMAMVALTLALVYFSSQHWISRPLHKAVELMGHIADGDLKAQIKQTSTDEIGQLLGATGRMAGHLRTTIADIRHASDTLANSASQLAAASNKVADGSRAQSQAAEAMATSVKEMTASIQQVADHAQSAHDMSASAGRASGEGAKVIGNAASEMAKIADTVRLASGTVSLLGDKSQEISAIARVIKEIADQTNLLALNAAIEAARAGEQGRGFAVVADEVRKLAERTTRSTQEISTMIDSIQGGTREAVASMGTGVVQVEDGVHFAQRAGESIAQIKTEAANVASAVQGISGALREQTTASNYIAERVANIVTQADSNALHAGETAEAAEHLQGLASHLKTSIARFRV